MKMVTQINFNAIKRERNYDQHKSDAMRINSDPSHNVKRLNTLQKSPPNSIHTALFLRSEAQLEDAELTYE